MLVSSYEFIPSGLDTRYHYYTDWDYSWGPQDMVYLMRRKREVTRVQIRMPHRLDSGIESWHEYFEEAR